LLIFRDKICTDQKYMQKVKWKRSTKLIILKFSSMKWNIFYNFKVKCHRPLIVCLEVPNVYSPIAVVQIWVSLSSIMTSRVTPQDYFLL
jgi:hypothetical protein